MIFTWTPEGIRVTDPDRVTTFSREFLEVADPAFLSRGEGGVITLTCTDRVLRYQLGEFITYTSAYEAKLLPETMGEAAARLGFPWDHTEFVCPGEHDHPCQFCDGGLTACVECNSFEGATTTQCPGRPMTATESDAVYRGELDYRAGQWVTVPSLYCPGGHKQVLT